MKNAEMNESIPIYWKTTLSDVEDTLSLVKRGTVTTPEISAGKRPIYMVEYGKSNLKRGLCDNVSSALGAHKYSAYADKTGEDYIPTVFLVGCIHGGEFEGTAALLNLIKLIETGTDYAGERNDELKSLAESVHLIIIPMVNPDGRARIPFNTFYEKTNDDIRYYNQGTWKDGTLCGWPGCKVVHPIKDYVDHLGAYFNDDGVNMMHEDFFSGNVSTGTRAVLDVCKREAPDFSALLHGGSASSCHILRAKYTSLKSNLEIWRLEEQVRDESAKRGVRFYYIGQRETEPENDTANPPSFNLVSAMHHCCAEPVITYESNQGIYNAKGSKTYDHAEIYEAHKILFTEIFKLELEKYGKL